MDPKAYPAEDFKALYHQRWQIEEQYKRQKQGVQIENFSGKSPEAIRQDFFAKQVGNNLASILVQAVQPLIDRQCSGRKLPYKANFAQALSLMKNQLIHLLRTDGLAEQIMTLLRALAENVEVCCQNRRFPRPITNLHHNLFHMAYKPCW